MDHLLTEGQRETRDGRKVLLLRDMAMLTLGFFSLLRRSELVALRLKDIRLHATSGVNYVNVRESKTD